MNTTTTRKRIEAINLILQFRQNYEMPEGDSSEFTFTANKEELQVNQSNELEVLEDDSPESESEEEFDFDLAVETYASLSTETLNITKETYEKQLEGNINVIQQ